MSTLRVNNMTNAGGTGPTYATGHVIQVVQGSTTTTVTNATTSQVDTGLTATITPKSTNSKILVTINHPIWKSSGNAENQISLFLYRDATQITQLATYLMANGAANTVTSSMTANYLDTPNTTSAVTYKTRFSNYVNASVIAVQQYNAPGTITLMEVAV